MTLTCDNLGNGKKQWCLEVREVPKCVLCSIPLREFGFYSLIANRLSCLKHEFYLVHSAQKTYRLATGLDLPNNMSYRVNLIFTAKEQPTEETKT